MATQTKEGKMINKQLLQSYKAAQAFADSQRSDMEQVIKSALFNGNGITEEVMIQIANISRSFDMTNDRVERTWNQYHDHCTTFDYEVQQ
jgi:hypothetical protein